MGGIWSCLSGLFKSREWRILMLGLDGTGKTTILYLRKFGKVIPTTPTMTMNAETVVHQKVKFHVFDVAGDIDLGCWRNYYNYFNADAIIYVVDSMDRDRVDISKQVIMSMLEVCVQAEELQSAVFVVLANKQDIPGCMTVTEVANSLGLEAIENRRFKIFETSALKNAGIEEAFTWLKTTLTG